MAYEIALMLGLVGTIMAFCYLTTIIHKWLKPLFVFSTFLFIMQVFILGMRLVEINGNDSKLLDIVQTGVVIMTPLIYVSFAFSIVIFLYGLFADILPQYYSRKKQKELAEKERKEHELLTIVE